VHVIQFGRLPGVGAVAIDAYGDVALQYEAGGVDVSGGVLELEVQVILQKEMKRDVVLDL
jgi:hypothetical protein